MKKVKIKIAIKTANGSQTGDFESGIATAPKPATPLQTVIEAAAHLARLAEIYEGAGDALSVAVAAAVKGVRDRAAKAA
jgi:hypothetical protein